MDLIKITDLTNRLGISSRSLRYYEQTGLIQSVRSDFEKYRYYDAANIERLKQIMVLRKMQIPIKDIIRIYESEDMSIVVETFVSRIRAIDEEVDALAELRSIVNEFLQAMLKNGVTKISALPILYEKMEKRLDSLERRKAMNYEELSALSNKLAKPVESSIVHLPSIRVLSSYLKDNSDKSDPDGFWRWVQEQGIIPGEPGRHEQFEFQAGADDVIILRIADDFVNDGLYLDYMFEGGLFAAANVYLDEDLGEWFRSLVSSFDNNKYYEIDYVHGGGLRHEAMLENLISSDEKRELVSLLIPVKKRLANPALFDKPEELEPGSITVEEIEAQNPVLWIEDVPMDKLIPINSPHYCITEQGEAEYISWISTRVLSTNVAVKLPFRVDIEFRIGEESGGYGHGSNEGSIRFYHGEDLNYVFGINMDNNPDERLSQEAICFHQPVFGDFFKYPKRGIINPDVYNRLTWIVGKKHFTVIINGEMRYCGINFPYMSADLSRQQARPIIVGSNSSIKRYFRSIRVSQLVQTPKIKIKEGALAMITKQSNNIIPNIHRFITSEYGENYHFNGGAKYVMECLHEPDYTYEFFAGLTGDVFAQVYPYDHFRGDGVTDYMTSEEGDGAFIERIFETCGYESTYVTKETVQKNREMYVQTLLSYIDKGVPVIEFGYGIEGPPWGVFVGYEEHGKILLLMTHNAEEPARVPLEDALTANWIFVGQKNEQKHLKQLYRWAILNLPSLLTTKTEHYCFGAEAFRTWAGDIENGKFDNMKPEDFDVWGMHSAYICNLATNGSCCYGFLKKAMELNPDFAFLDEVREQYNKMGRMWNNQNGEDLEALGGGFNVTLNALQDKAKRSKIAAKICEFADCADEIVRILRANL